jgi:hypothetical protein
MLSTESLVGMYIYDAEASCGSITFTNNTTEGSVTRWCRNVAPIAKVEGLSPLAPTVAWFTLPANLVRTVTDNTNPEWANRNPYFTYQDAGGETNKDATTIIDLNTLMDGMPSKKITWAYTSGDPCSSEITSIGTTYPTSATLYPVLSFWYKSDTEQIISAYHTDGAVYSGIKVAGDGVWRLFVGINGSPTTFTSGPNLYGLKIITDATAGNLWITGISAKRFTSLSEASNWAGCMDRASIKAVTALAPVNDKYPIVGSNPLVSTWKTNNSSATNVYRLKGGYEGQEIDVMLGDINTTIRSTGEYFDYVYTYQTTTWSANLATGTGIDMFADTVNVGDYLILGNVSGPPCGFRFKITAATANNYTDDGTNPFTYEYWNGSAWTALVVSKPDIFRAAAGSYYNCWWDIPADWQPSLSAPASPVRAWWVKISVNAHATGGSEGGQAQYAIAPLNWMINGDFGPRVFTAGGTCSYDGMLKLKMHRGIWREQSRTLFNAP